MKSLPLLLSLHTIRNKGAMREVQGRMKVSWGASLVCALQSVQVEGRRRAKQGSDTLTKLQGTEQIIMNSCAIRSNRISRDGFWWCPCCNFHCWSALVHLTSTFCGVFPSN